MKRERLSDAERLEYEPQMDPDTVEPIVTHPALLHFLWKQDKGSDLATLYQFYYSVAKRQKTNQPFATNSYVSKGLGFGIGKIAELKDRLIKLGLIQKVVRRDPASGKIVGNYISVKYIWSMGQVKGVDHERENPAYGETMNGDTGRVDSPVPAKSGANALSISHINALSRETLCSGTKAVPERLVPEPKTPSLSSSQNGDLPQPEQPLSSPIKASPNKGPSPYYELAKQLGVIVGKKQNTRIPPEKLRKWAKPIELLHTRDKVDPARIKESLTWYASHIGEDYVPVILGGDSLREKFPKLLAAIDRSNHPWGNRNGNGCQQQPRPTAGPRSTQLTPEEAEEKYGNIVPSVMYNWETDTTIYKEDVLCQQN